MATLIKEYVKVKKLKESIDEFRQTEEIFFKDTKKCIYCNDIIYYVNDSSIRVKKNGEIIRTGKTADLTKIINGKVYHLAVCERCLVEKYPEFNDKNKSKVFNTFNHITKYAFNVSNEDIIEHSKTIAVTLENLCRKYGDEEGTKRFNAYREKQSYTNSLEYKKEKYGWSDEQFKEYNKSRAVTLKNMCIKYGDELGKIKFEEYRKKQSYVGVNVNYFIDKYGYIEGNKKYSEINKSKAITLENYRIKYGDVLGEEKFTEHISKSPSFYSKISQEFISALDELLKEFKLTTYYATKNQEFGKLLTSNRYVKLDYYIKELNLCVEFNGDCFHANPLIYSKDDRPNVYNKKITSEDIW